jgi:D-threo-aldose 1-dehydrogenase
MNHVAPLARIVAEADVDCILLAGRYTLLDHAGALGLLDACGERGVAVIAAGVFNSGLLAGGSTFDYAPAGEDLLARARELQAACEEHDVPLPAARDALPARSSGGGLRARRRALGARGPGQRRGVREADPRGVVAGAARSRTD